MDFPGPQPSPWPPVLGSSPSTSLTTRTNLFFSSAAKTRPLDHTLSLLPLLPARDVVTWNTAISAALRHRCPDAALRLFHDMLLSSSSLPDTITLRSILRACSESKHYHLLPQLHAYILKLLPLFSLSEQTILNTCLLNVCFKFESIVHAHELFDRIPHRDVVTFTSMFSGCAESGQHAEALRVFCDMLECDHVEMNEHAYCCALHVCAGFPSLLVGRQIHSHVIKSMMGSDVFVGTGLVDVYVKCDEVDCARRAFVEISEPNVVSWNALMGGNLDGDEVLQLFFQMRLSDVKPDHVTFANVLRACKNDFGIYSIRQMHGLLVKMMEAELDVFVGGALLEVYLDQGFFNEAQAIFGEMKEKDDVAFNLAIQGYLRNGHGVQAVALFVEALKMGKELSEVTLTSLLTWVGGLEQVKQMHALVTKFGCCDRGGSTSISGSLIRMYTEHQCLDDAVQLFERIRLLDLVLWTSLISGFARSGESQAAVNLYARMITEKMVEPPNHYTFSTLLSSCAHLVAVEEGKQIHAQIIKSDLDIESDPFVATGLFYMYAKFGYMKEARRVFDEMPERDLASWNAMISSLSQHGFAEKAIEAFEELLNKSDLKPNNITYVGVLSACSRCGMVEDGKRYFKSIKEPTIDHYTCLIDLFGRAGWFREALDLVEGMPFEANELIWSSLLAASRIHGNVELGEYSAKQLLLLDPTDPGTYVALSNVYAAAGRWEDVRRIRKLMRSQTERRYSGISWLLVNGENYVFPAHGRSFISK